MFLVDTSVWVEFLRSSSRKLVQLLLDDQVLAHPAVVGELALGRLSNRDEILALLAALPRASVASNDEVMHCIEARLLYGRGIGWVDAQLVAAALVSDCGLWTFDRKLRTVAGDIGLPIAP